MNKGKWVTINGTHVFIQDQNYRIVKNMKTNSFTKKYNDDVTYICKITAINDIEKEYGKLKNYDLIVTDERLKHIIERRKDDAFVVADSIEKTIKEYDAIYDDTIEGKNREPGVVYVKKIAENMTCAVAVALSTKNSNKANSVITGIMLSDSVNRYLKNRKKIV